jgi:hypothetical protein
MMMTYDEFIDSYNNVLSYLSNKDPVFTEYLISNLPHPLQVSQQVLKKARKQKKSWLEKSKQKISKKSVEKLSILPSGRFNDSLYNIGCVYTYGSGNIVPNFYRAEKYTRVMKLLGDNRYKELEKEMNTRKRKRNQKILGTIN